MIFFALALGASQHGLVVRLQGTPGMINPTAVLSDETGTAIRVTLKDDGKSPDMSAGDGGYAGNSWVSGNTFRVELDVGGKIYPGSTAQWPADKDQRDLNLVFQNGQVQVETGAPPRNVSPPTQAGPPPTSSSGPPPPPSAPRTSTGTSNTSTQTYTLGAALALVLLSLVFWPTPKGLPTLPGPDPILIEPGLTRKKGGLPALQEAIAQLGSARPLLVILPPDAPLTAQGALVYRASPQQIHAIRKTVAQTPRIVVLAAQTPFEPLKALIPSNVPILFFEPPTKEIPPTQTAPE